MEKTEAGLINRYPVASYFALACGSSWLIQVPLALQAQEVIQTQIPFALHYLSAFGPLLSAVYVTWRLGGNQGLAKLFRRLGKWRVGLGWWLIAFSPVFALILLTVRTMLIHGDVLSLRDLGSIDYLPNLGIGAAFFWIATFGLGEETGWRGFALPRLQAGRSALFATLILWAMWSVWHLPLFFYMYDARILAGWLIALLAGSITFTWLFNSTGGSLLMTVIFHGLFNYATACARCKTGLAGAVTSSLVMVWAVLVVLIYKPAHLSGREKVVDQS